MASQLFGFLTTDAHKEVGDFIPKAMPVIFTRSNEVEAWPTLSTDDVLKLQNPLADGMLKIVARGEKEDGVSPAVASLERCLL